MQSKSTYSPHQLGRPRITIIIPTCNRAPLLPRAISSVLGQDFEDFQLVVVDDGSTDNTKEVLESFADPRLCYYRLSENMGVLVALNRGLDLTKGDYVCLLGDDDELLPGAIRTAVELLDRLIPKGIRIVWFDCVDAATGRPCGSGFAPGLVSYQDLLCRARGDHWRVMDTSLGGRFDERIFGSEGLLWLRLHRTAKAYYFPRASYLVHRDHPTLSYDARVWSRNKEKIVLAKREFLDKHGYDAEHLCPEVYARELSNLGLYLGLSGKKLESCTALLRSMKYVRSISIVILLVLVIILPANRLESLWVRYSHLRPSARQRRSQWSAA